MPVSADAELVASPLTTTINVAAIGETKSSAWNNSEVIGIHIS